MHKLLAKLKTKTKPPETELKIESKIEENPDSTGPQNEVVKEENLEENSLPTEPTAIGVDKTVENVGDNDVVTYTAEKEIEKPMENANLPLIIKRPSASSLADANLPETQQSEIEKIENENVPKTPETPAKTAKKTEDKIREKEKVAKEQKQTENSAKIDADSEDSLIEGTLAKNKDKNEDLHIIKSSKHQENLVAKTKHKTEDLPITKPIFGNEFLFAVVIHETDRLKTNLYISHPLVVVHLIDSKTGNYLKKSQIGKAVTYHNENAKIDAILPIMTSPYKSAEILNATHPKWEEILIFNETFDYVTKDSGNVMLIFEIVDFTSMTAAKHRFEEYGKSGGWHKIAWAFVNLSTISENKSAKQLRLQMFRTPKHGHKIKATEHTAEVYQWWKYLARVPYPSTLYVTLKPLLEPKSVPSATRSMFALQDEIGPTSAAIDNLLKGTQFAKLERLPSDKIDGKVATTIEVVNIWDRLKDQQCKIPNKLLCKLPVGKYGCFRIQFSPDGRILACASKTHNQYPIYCYEIPSATLISQLNGHGGLAYDLNFNSNSKLIVSASADCTARIWNVESAKTTAVLPHPTFVYCATFVPKSDDTQIVTACYDNNLRIWTNLNETNTWTIAQLLSNHKSYVNDIEFVSGESQFYSGDGQGNLLLWSTNNGIWELSKDFGAESFQHKPISCVKLHPDKRRLFVSTRDDSCIQAIDSRIFLAMRRYEIGTVNQLPIRFDLSPCGTYLFGGSEIGEVFVWKIDSGEKLVHYDDGMGLKFPVLDVKYHPFDHMVAFAYFGEGQQVLLYKYDKSVPELHLDPQQLQTDKTDNSTLFNNDYLNYSVAKLLEEHKILLDDSQVVITKTTEMLGELISTPKMTKSGNVGKRRKAKNQNSTEETSAIDMQSENSDVVNRPESQTPLIKVKALHRYKAQNNDEISFAKGDLITVVSMQNPDWWIGFVEAEKTGYFPSNYVKKI